LQRYGNAAGPSKPSRPPSRLLSEERIDRGVHQVHAGSMETILILTVFFSLIATTVVLACSFLGVFDSKPDRLECERLRNLPAGQSKDY
jgi:hypothetical protein